MGAQRESTNVLWTWLLDNVEILRLDEIGGLEAKLRLEQAEPAKRFLVYSPPEEPEYEAD